jgi:itaconate CoA-transferase
VTTKDGNSIYIAIQNPGEWTRLCTEVLGLPQLATDPRFATNPLRVANRAALAEVIAGVIGPTAQGSMTSAQLIEKLEAANIAYARMNSMTDFIAHPQLAARGRWREVATPAGPVAALAPPVMIDGSPPCDARMDAVPALGEHTDAILEELGFTAGTIAGWRRGGTI